MLNEAENRDNERYEKIGKANYLPPNIIGGEKKLRNRKMKINGSINY
jgi:hypothetical protein